jgi:hypothetical protein
MEFSSHLASRPSSSMQHCSEISIITKQINDSIYITSKIWKIISWNLAYLEVVISHLIQAYFHKKKFYLSTFPGVFTMATAAILNLFNPQKLPHTTVNIPTKFHEVWWKESKIIFLNPPFFFPWQLTKIDHHSKLCSLFLKFSKWPPI